MPTYEYECLACRHVFEYFQSMKDEPIKTCPACKGEVKRLIGAGAGFIFKGSGFYQTDYRSSEYKKQAQSDQKPSSAPTPAPAPADTASSAKPTNSGSTPKSSESGT